MPEKSNGKITYTFRIGTGGSYYYDNVILATYEADESAPRILEDDMVTIYGTLCGEYTYETVVCDVYGCNPNVDKIAEKEIFLALSPKKCLTFFAYIV